MFSGIPLVIGAKKGWPNFNKFTMQTVANVTRKLQFLKTTASKPPYLTNQMYVVAISNAFGVEAWNSYTNPFPRTLQMIAAADMSAGATNELGKVLVNRLVSTNTPSILIPATTWSGFNNPQRPRPSFQVPVDPSTNTFWFLPVAPYSKLNRQFVVPPPGAFENPSCLPVPPWFLNVRARLRFILIDPGVNRIVDYENLDDS